MFFAVEKSPHYSQLSGNRLEINRAGERVDVDCRKRNLTDFALWKVLNYDVSGHLWVPFTI